MQILLCAHPPTRKGYPHMIKLIKFKQSVIKLTTKLQINNIGMSCPRKIKFLTLFCQLDPPEGDHKGIQITNTETR